jgi:hypothetical protein
MKDVADLKLHERSGREVHPSKKLCAIVGHVSLVYPPWPVLAVCPTIDENQSIIYQLSVMLLT